LRRCSLAVVARTAAFLLLLCLKLVATMIIVNDNKIEHVYWRNNLILFLIIKKEDKYLLYNV